MADGNDDFISGFMNDYFEESDEHLATLRGLLLSLDSLDGVQQIAPSTLEEMFRVFHSIKGISGMVELREAEMLAHELESYLRALRQREAILSPAGVDALVAGVDALERVIVARRENRAAPPVSGAIAEIAAVMPGGTSATLPTGVVGPPAGQQPQAEWVVTFVPSAALSDRGLNVDSVRARPRSPTSASRGQPRPSCGGRWRQVGTCSSRERRGSPVPWCRGRNCCTGGRWSICTWGTRRAGCCGRWPWGP